MTPERYEQIGNLYQAALEREPSERAAFLAEVCDGDDELRREVASLVAAHGQAEGFIEQPPDDVAAGWQAAACPLPRNNFSHYRMLSPLGRGGMGEVWLAEDTRLRRKVAVKLLPAEFTTRPERVRRFAQEARAASALNHPNIITIHEIGEAKTETGDAHYIVTEYVEGETLRRRMTNAPPNRMRIAEAVDVAAQVAAALSAAHEAGITHRDIRPENVMLRHDGYVKVLDFGLAKLTEPPSPAVDSQAPTAIRNSTETGVMMGTPRYMSPEQARGEKADARTDIFSLGVMLYEMVAGRAPFTGATTSEIIAAILRDEPPPLADHAPEAPPELQHLVGKALRKNRKERYQTADELLADLKHFQRDLEFASEEKKRSARATSEGEEKFVVPPSGGMSGQRELPPEGGTTNRRRVIAATVALACLVLAAVAVWSYYNRQPLLTARDTVLLADFDNKTGDAIFDGTLRQWLATQLEQSQMLRVFPEARVQQTLRQMERPSETRVTAEIAHEVCERQNLKAFIAGSIAPLGSRYVLTLEAVQGQNGETLARAQAEATSKEQVLEALSGAATRLGAQLGRSLSSIQLSERPLQQITTADLRAVKALSECNYLAARGRFVEALPFAKRAVELDPRLPGGYSFLSILSLVAGQPEAAAEYQRKAFQLTEERAARQPDQVSEVSKVASLSWYHRLTTGDQTKAQEYGLLYRQLAPRHAPAYNDLGFSYLYGGQFEGAIPLMQEAIRLNPDFAAPYRGLAEALIRLNRFAEARDTLARALGLKLEITDYHAQLYQLAFVDGDAAGMRLQLDWAKGQPEEYVAFDWQTGAAAFAGRWREAQEFSRQAVNLAALGENREVAARYATEHAVRGAVMGDCRGSRAGVAQGLDFGRGRLPLSRAALALALCGEAKQSQSLVDELTKRFPEDTLANSLWATTIRATIALQRGDSGNGAAPQAIEQLQPAARYEPVAEFWPQYLRGQAYLQLKQGAAAAEFQKILDHRGRAPLSPLYPLAHLGLARAAALTGDAARSHKAYEGFFAAWREDDVDLPILREAKREYEHLAKR